jgi:hypothetical protein
MARRLIAYRVGGRWFAQVVEDRGDFKEIRRVDVPQSQNEIESYARENGYEIEWGDAADRRADDDLRRG